MAASSEVEVEVDERGENPEELSTYNTLSSGGSGKDPDSAAYTRVGLKQCDHCSLVQFPCQYEGRHAILRQKRGEGHTMKDLYNTLCIRCIHITLHVDLHHSLR